MIQPEQLAGIEDLVRADPAFIEACGKRGITDMNRVMCDPWSAGRFGHGRRGDPPRLPRLLLGQAGRGRELLRPPARGAQRRRRHPQARGAPGRRPRRHSRTGRQPRVFVGLPVNRAGDLRAIGHRPARRCQLRTRWPSDFLARVGTGDRVQRSRGGDPCTTSGTAAVRWSTARRSRRWWSPMVRPTGAHYRKNVFDVGGIRCGQARQLAQARLRLPGRDPLPGRLGHRHPRRPGPDRQCDLHPRGGRRHPVEAPRPAQRPDRGPPGAAPGDFEHQSRSETTTTATTGTCISTARSNSR